MIKSIVITNYLKESIRLTLDDPWESGLIVESIDGLGPPKADVNFTELATADGGIENSERLTTRNIVLNLRFLEKPTIEDTRLLTYKYFPIKRKLTFHIETDNKICEIDGIVESNEPDIFSQEEGCQISILCPDPYFRKAKKSDTWLYGTEPMFEFPFSNESLDENLIVFGLITENSEKTIVYEGDSEVGFILRIHTLGKASGIVIYDLDTRQVLKIDDAKLKELTDPEGQLETAIIDGDTIEINSVNGQKGIKLIRSGYETNILNALVRPMPWFKLYKGRNTFVFTAEEGIDDLQFQIEYNTIYEGV